MMFPGPIKRNIRNLEEEREQQLLKQFLKDQVDINS
jgi:hypothetical protein